MAASTPAELASAPDVEVAIVGGGIGGLAAAVALHRRGVRVRVFERDAAFAGRKQGYGLTLQPTPALTELRLVDRVRALDTASEEHWTFAADGRVLGYFGNAYRPGGGQGSRGNLRVPREVLRRELHDQLPEGTVVYGARVAGFDDGGARAGNGRAPPLVTLQFEPAGADAPPQPPPTTCAVLVGADGIKSRVRQCMLERAAPARSGASAAAAAATVDGASPASAAAPVPVGAAAAPGGGGGLSYLGVTVVLGLSTAQHPLLARRGFYTLDGAHRLFTMPFGGGGDDSGGGVLPGPGPHPPLTMWQLSFAEADEGAARALCAGGASALLGAARARCARWHDPVLPLLDASLGGEVWGTPLYDFGETGAGGAAVGLPPGKGGGGSGFPRDWFPRVTLLGDAAHPMSPFKGQGANQALRDGPRLAACLARAAVAPALAAFEREMAAHAGPKVLASRAAAAALHCPAALTAPAAVAGVGADDAAAAVALSAARHVGAWDAAALVERFRACVVDAGGAAVVAVTAAGEPEAAGFVAGVTNAPGSAPPHGAVATTGSANDAAGGADGRSRKRNRTPAA